MVDFFPLKPSTQPFCMNYLIRVRLVTEEYNSMTTVTAPSPLSTKWDRARPLLSRRFPAIVAELPWASGRQRRRPKLPIRHQDLERIRPQPPEQTRHRRVQHPPRRGRVKDQHQPHYRKKRTRAFPIILNWSYLMATTCTYSQTTRNGTSSRAFS